MAAAQLEQARVLWVPSLTVGMDYTHHGGVSANEAGEVTNSSNNALMFGVGSGLQNAAIVNIDEAVFAPWWRGRTSAPARPTSRRPRTTPSWP